VKKFEKIYDIVSSIPKGKITTYGAIAKLVVVDPRVVGYALHQNKDPRHIPCHRVINSKGQISSGYVFGGPNTQKEMLEKEGILFDDNEAVNLKRFGYLI